MIMSQIPQVFLLNMPVKEADRLQRLSMSPMIGILGDATRRGGKFKRRTGRSSKKTAVSSTCQCGEAECRGK